VRVNKALRRKKSARATRFLRRIHLKELSRRPAVRAGLIATALLVVGVTAAVIRATHDGSAALVATVSAKEAPAAPAPKRASAGTDLVALNAPAAPAEKPAADKPATVTLTGCLERNDQSFRLRDTTGADVPTSRSWKTGFITKRKASVTVADKANRLKLQSHVGQRVKVTGTLVDREMQVRSLERIAASCTANTKA